MWPELWTNFGRNSKLKEKQKWSNEKPKLDNPRRSRGIYFIAAILVQGHLGSDGTPQQCETVVSEGLFVVDLPFVFFAFTFSHLLVGSLILGEVRSEGDRLSKLRRRIRFSCQRQFC